MLISSFGFLLLICGCSWLANKKRLSIEVLCFCREKTFSYISYVSPKSIHHLVSYLRTSVIGVEFDKSCLMTIATFKAIVYLVHHTVECAHLESPIDFRHHDFFYGSLLGDGGTHLLSTPNLSSPCRSILYNLCMYFWSYVSFI